MLQFYNSLTRRKEEFHPIEPGKVRMYVCGITVYDYCHIGHARMLVVFDTVVRYLRFRGLEVTYVRNITDIDDKIIRRARENGEEIGALTERFIRAMDEDCAALGMLRPDIEPRATDSIQAIIDLIQELMDLGYAYLGANGDVYYAVSRFERYGQLSNKRLEDLRSGARVEVEEAKADPLDFVLWKAAKPDEPSWPAPWGPGRPGWHIECSAMSRANLGRHFDIHGGGLDLKFPHHENEIAQSEPVEGHPWVNYWLHNGFVQVNEEKMSKSLGNFFTIRDVLQRYRPEVVRCFIIASHYRSPLNYTEDNLNQARASLNRLYTALRGLEFSDQGQGEGSFEQRFVAAMDDDFNSAEAMGVLFDLAREINRLRDAGDMAGAARLGGELRRLGALLGLLQDDPEGFLKGAGGSGPTDGEIDALVTRRTEARRSRNFAEADRIRDELAARGVLLEDGPGGTTWRRES